MPQRAIFYFRDNNDAVSQVTVNLPDGLSLSSCEAFALALSNALNAASNALLTGFELRRDIALSGLGAPSFNSNVYDRSILLFTGENGSGSIVIPSGRTDLYEQTGDYANIRYTPIENVPSVYKDIADLLNGIAEYPTGVPYSGSLVYVGRMVNIL